jgi:hypothetical protein
MLNVRRTAVGLGLPATPGLRRPAQAEPDDDRRDPQGHLASSGRASRRAARPPPEQNVDIVWRGPLREDGADSQVSEVQGFVSRGVSASCSSARQTARSAVPVANAVAEGSRW